MERGESHWEPKRALSHFPFLLCHLLKSPYNLVPGLLLQLYATSDFAASGLLLEGSFPHCPPLIQIQQQQSLGVMLENTWNNSTWNSESSVVSSHPLPQDPDSSQQLHPPPSQTGSFGRGQSWPQIHLDIAGRKSLTSSLAQRKCPVLADFVKLTQAIVIWEEVTSTEKVPTPHWPVENQ